MRFPIRSNEFGFYIFGFNFVRPEWELRCMKHETGYKKFTFMGWLVFRRK